MLENFLSDPSAIKRWKAGLFWPHMDSFVATVSELGYARSTVRERLRLLDDLEQWLKRKRLVLVNLQEVVERFLGTRRRARRLRNSDARTVHHFLEHLRSKGAIPSPELPVDRSPLAMLQKQYETYLRQERGLAPATIGRYWRFLRHFLVERFGEGPICLRTLAPDDISGFLLRHARSGSPGVAKLMVAAVCSRSAARDVITTVFRFRTMSERQSLPTCGKIGRAAQHGEFSSATGHLIAALAIRVPSARLSTAPWGGQDSNRPSRGPTFCDTLWPPECFAVAHPWPRSAKSSVTACRTRRKSTQRLI